MRIRSLDGLRGLAAVIVLAHHSLLALPQLAEPYVTGSRASDPFAAAMLYTPLHFLWEGRAAVFIFFILSGIVLTIPVLKQGAQFSWWGYYPQRLLRLYVPVWAAVVLGIAWVLIVPRTAGSTSPWLEGRAWEMAPEPIIRDLTLVAGNGDTVSPLWSLQWEILFSLLFPVFVFVGVRLAKFWWAIIAASLVLIAGSGFVDQPALTYLPMFMIGVALATVFERVLALGARMNTATGWLLTAVAVLALVAPWMAQWAVGTSRTSGPVTAVATFGGLVAVFLAMTFPPIRRFLETRPLQWLGLVSFSLYLVHEPIVISAAYFFGDALLPVALIVGAVVSFAVAWVFYRLVEKPSHRLARFVGDFVRARAGARPQRHAPIAPQV